MKRWQLILFCMAYMSLISSCKSQKKPAFTWQKPPNSPQVFYYNFYNDVQMIEVDRESHWNQDIWYHEQTQPRALEWSMLIPHPGPNVIIMRHRSGEILKVFNGPYNTSTLKSVKNIEGKTIAHSSFARALGRHQAFKSFDNHIYTTPYYNYYIVDSSFNKEPYSPSWGLNSYSNSHFQGLLDSLGNVVLPAKYRNIQTVNKHYIVYKDEKAQLLDSAFNKISIPKCDHLYQAHRHHNFLLISKNVNTKNGSNTERIGVIDLKGQEILPMKYSSIRVNQHWIMAKNLGDWKWLIFDHKGDALNTDGVENFGEYSEGLIAFRKDRLWGYMNNEGEVIIPNTFHIAQAFKEGKAKIGKKQDDGKYVQAYIDKTGKIISPFGPWKSH